MRTHRGFMAGLAVASIVAAGGAWGQEVFSNGVDVAGTYVVGNGMITLQSTTNSQGDAATRTLAPSVGQLFGVDPDTGSAIAVPGNLLQLKPRQLVLTDASNRVYVIAANQITNGTSITVTYSGARVVIGVASSGIGSTQLANGAVTSAKIGSGAVGSTQLAGSAVTSAKIASGAVGATQLASAAVTAAKLASNAVGSSQLTNGAVTSAKIATGAVGAAQLADGAVAQAKLAAGAVGTNHLAQPQVDGRYLNAVGDTVTGPLTVQSTLTIAGTNLLLTGTSTRLGHYASGTDSSVAVGYLANGGAGGVAVGYDAAVSDNATACGAAAAAGMGSTAVGSAASADVFGAAYGTSATAGLFGQCVGTWSTAGDNATVLGFCSAGSSWGVAIGEMAQATNGALGLGAYAEATGVGSFAVGGYYGAPPRCAARRAGQLGPGINTASNSLQFLDWPLVLDGGHVPAARLTNAWPTVAAGGAPTGRFHRVMGPAGGAAGLDLAQGNLLGAWQIVPQGDLSMGSFTNRNP